MAWSEQMCGKGEVHMFGVGGGSVVEAQTYHTNRQPRSAILIVSLAGLLRRPGVTLQFPIICL